MAAKSIATLAIKIIADAAGLQVGFTKAERSVAQFSSQVKMMAGTLGGMLGIGSASAIGAWAVKLAGDLERTKIQFEVLTGSASQAAAVVEDMRKFGAVTPFESADLLNATKILMAFGIEAGQATQDVKMLSNVAMGDAVKLESVAMAFGKINADAKLMGDQLNVLSNLGFNPLQVISEKTGESMASLRKRMEAGQISFQMVADAFRSVTSEGGRFYNMNSRMSEDMLGKWSTLKDEAAMLATTIGEEVVPTLKIMIDTMRPLVAMTGWLAAKFSELSKNPFFKILSSGGVSLDWILSPSKMQKDIAAWVNPASPFQVVKGMPEEAKAVQATRDMSTQSVGLWDVLKSRAEIYGNQIKTIADRMTELAGRADKLRESLRTPLEIARDAMAELNQLATFGLIDPDMFARGAIKVREELVEALKAQRGIKELASTAGVGALQRGTMGAFSAVQSAGREFRDMAARQAEQVKLQAEANAILGRIEAKESVSLAEVTL